MSRIGSIYVEVRGDYSKWQEDIRALKTDAKKSGTEVSDALNNALSPKQASAGISKLSEDHLREATRGRSEPKWKRRYWELTRKENETIQKRRKANGVSDPYWAGRKKKP